MNFKIRPSGYLFALITVIHVGAVICVGSISVFWVWKLLLILALLFNLGITGYHFVLLKSPWSIVEFYRHSKDVWNLLRRDGKVIQARLNGDGVVTNGLLILSFKPIARSVLTLSRKMVLFPDNLPNGQFRALKVALRYGEK